mgnify:CR=1 FL=1
MILVSVGTQLGFDRLMVAIDSWAADNKELEIIAQIGPGKFIPRNFKSVQFFQNNEFNEKFEEADVIISHAGMGNIIGAMELNKNIIIMPRKASLGEHRNEHQLGTADAFRCKTNIHVVEDEGALRSALDKLIHSKTGGTNTKIPLPSLLCENIKVFIES